MEVIKSGATRLCTKVDTIPKVDQLRPITLLQLDYKFLTIRRSIKSTSFMGEKNLWIGNDVRRVKFAECKDES